jgi:Uma2 family endonuclease
MKAMPTGHGPFLAEHLRSGDPYELSNGHAIRCMPTGGRGSKAEGAGYKVLSTDPGVEDVGIDTGYSTAPDSLRAPDLSAGKIPDAPGWVKGVPRLAVEYADTGQDEDDLTAKIDELLAAGTEAIWVVRLTGPRRVEVHLPEQPLRTAYPGEELEAPGILKHPVPVDSLYDDEASNKVAFRNLLEKETGLRSLDQVREEGREKGREEGREEGRETGELEALRSNLLAVLEARRLEVDEALRAAVAECHDPGRLRRWNVAAITASSAGEILDA